MRKLEEQDRQKILEYVGREPEMNLFIIGDIENFGVDTDEVEIFVNEVNGQWDSLALRYFDNFILYSHSDEYEGEPVAQLLKDKGASGISGKASVIKRLEPYFADRKVDVEYLSRCGRQEWGKSIGSQGESRLFNEKIEGFEIRAMKGADAMEAVEFYCKIEEFASSYRGREEEARKINESNLNSGGRGVGAFRAGKLVAAAQTTASTTRSAMVVAVATEPGLRGQGLASAVLGKLCTESFAEGKEFLCLFYDNPVAGRIYNRMGFVEMGEYALFKKI